jgi:hemoglobin
MKLKHIARSFLFATLLAGSTVVHAEETLFAQIGGEAKLRASVDKLVEIMLVDERINFTFAETDLNKFKGLLYDQLCELTGGPCKYTGRDMIESHKKLNTTNEQFNALAEDLYKAFDSQGVPYRVQNRVMALLAPMQPQVVDKVPEKK